MNKPAIVYIIILTMIFMVVISGCAKSLFKISNLIVSPIEVESGKSATISIDVNNIGETEGTYPVILKINGVQVDEQDITVGPGATRQVIFTVLKENTGSYVVDVNGLTATMQVIKSAEFELNVRIISPSEIQAGSSCNIIVDVTNISEVEGDCEAALKINGQIVQTKEIFVDASTTKTVNFTLFEEKPGTYNISVDGSGGTLMVTPLHTTRIGVGATAYDWFAQKTWGGFWDMIDPIPFLASNGFNWLRVGVTTVSTPELEDNYSMTTWRNEFWCSREYALQVLKAGEKVGMQLCLFFYLSDQAAHGGKQKSPSGWENYSLEETAAALKQHTFETTKYYKDKGLNIDLYEIGNEIDFGITGYSFDTKLYLPGIDIFHDFSTVRQQIWAKEAVLLKAAIEGVKEVDPEAKIILHICTTEWPDLVEAFFQAMIDFEVPYDFAGLSYYPWLKWHPEVPSPSNYLDMSIEAIAKLGKETILCEVSFPSSTTPLLPIHEVTGYPFTLEGQAEWVHDLLRMAEINPHINTVFYFYPDNYIVEDCGAASLFINDEHPKPAIYEFLEFQNSDLPLKTNPSEN